MYGEYKIVVTDFAGSVFLDKNLKTERESVIMKTESIIKILKDTYGINVQNVKLLRKIFSEDNSSSCEIYEADRKYLLKAIHLPYSEADTSLNSADIQKYLFQDDFPVIPIIFTKEGTPCIRTDEDKNDDDRSERETKYIFVYPAPFHESDSI